MQQLLETHPLILMEGAIIETLRRSGRVRLHPELENAPLIYGKDSRKILAGLYQDYLGISMEAGLPMLLCTPTWRANRERVKNSEFSKTINQDAAQFMQDIRLGRKPEMSILIGGMIGCRNDCYRPEEALTTEQAEQFHDWQISELVKGGVDFLIAETLPNINEALGIAQAMQQTGLPYIISFVISREGALLDGTSLITAVQLIDDKTNGSPVGYMVNCAHPSFLCPDRQPPDLFSRLVGYQANASALDHCDLDCTNQLETSNVAEWTNLMLDLNQTYGVKILGGCCGTSVGHMREIASSYAKG